MIKRISILIITILLFGQSAIAYTYAEAKKLYAEGKYSEALPALITKYKRTPRNASLNQWIGVCLFHAEEYNDAIKYLEFANSKKILEAPYYLALIYYKTGDFKCASEYIDRYNENLDNADKDVPTAYKNNIESIKAAQIMLEHVQKIEIIDSLIINKRDFYKAYKISPDIARLESTDILGIDDNDSTILGPIYVPESKTRRLWAASNESEKLNIYQSIRLFDNTWDNPEVLDESLSLGGNAAYPYMMPDGTTLYYASDGEGSIGGYDIFVASKDIETGKFYLPQNIGMPFNSIYDDYMLAIDELTGAGWWATDRNQIEDSLTIYIFKPLKVRVNYNADDPNITSYAKINAIADTWPEGADYSELIASINSINMKVEEQDEEFRFIISNDKIYTRLTDFNSYDAKKMVKEWLNMNNQQTQLSAILHKKRVTYSTGSGDADLSGEILALEKELDILRKSISAIANDIRKLEL